MQQLPSGFLLSRFALRDSIDRAKWYASQANIPPINWMVIESLLICTISNILLSLSHSHSRMPIERVMYLFLSGSSHQLCKMHTQCMKLIWSWFSWVWSYRNGSSSPGLISVIILSVSSILKSKLWLKLWTRWGNHVRFSTFDFHGNVWIVQTKASKIGVL